MQHYIAATEYFVSVLVRAVLCQFFSYMFGAAAVIMSPHHQPWIFGALVMLCVAQLVANFEGQMVAIRSWRCQPRLKHVYVVALVAPLVASGVMVVRNSQAGIGLLCVALTVLGVWSCANVIYEAQPRRAHV